ncbi:glycosyl hydrolase-like protein [Ophiobolus disseminans]|uniref:Glycosyl hydrolase-like protein n=1 Tax=Ophiobolus disseminans TaxID=1469910 RepID=A0A6A6ZMT4_9PLEO|nr:glycosyl hydrolase-like protein [Ophiobolus disseminans]
MHTSSLIGLVAAFSTQVFAACSGPTKIDDFSKWSTKTNSLGEWTSDDSSMSSISATSGVLNFKPKSGSYFYETFPCQAASSKELSAVQFTLKGPSQGSVVVELQTKASCSAASYSSYYTQVTGLTGNSQTITLPFTAFSGANGNAVTGLVWSGFSSNTVTWQLSNIALVCPTSGGSPSSAAPASSRAASSSAAPASSRASSSAAASVSSRAASSSAVSATRVSSSVASSVSRASSVSSARSTLATVSSSQASGTCAPLLIDDWISQSRLTFLFYNSFNYPTSADDSVQSLTVGKPSSNRVEIVPKGDGGYFYSQFPCVDASTKYGGISLRIKAPRGATLSVELDSSDNCDPVAAKTETHSSAELGWTFDGTEKLYSIPFSKYPSLNKAKLTTILFSGFSTTVSFGPMSFYCGNTVSEWVVAPVDGGSGSSSTVAAPPNPSATALVVDKFANANTNAMGNWHGGDDGMTLAYNGGKLTITSPDADYSFYTQVSGTCSDFNKYKGSYLHIAYSGTTKFTVALQQHNQGCNSEVAPFPETWDSADAERYAKNGNIYIPMSHFKVDFSRVIGFALKGFHTTESVTLSSIEIVPSVPAGFAIPPKDDTGTLVFACKRPNSFAFAIDDGIPGFAQDVLKIIREEKIKVTFFTVGAPLLDQGTNLTNVYKEMMSAGHQLALHSFTHPKMESLPDYAAIDWEYNEDIKAMKSQFNGLETPYFRPPFGNEGARMRARLAKAVGPKATITNWSVDVEDWLWAETSTPENQLTAFKRDVAKGGNLVVLHYLYPSTVQYLREFIQIAKATGKDLMRVDQCMEDPAAPPYVKGQ